MFKFFKKKESVVISSVKTEPSKFVENSVDASVDPIMLDDLGESSVVNEKSDPILEKEIKKVDSKDTDAKQVELESQIGKLVICISNQYENPRVCVGIEVVNITKSKIPVLSVFDIVRKEKTVPLGIIFDYSEQKFDALNQMDPNARIALFFNRLSSNIISKKPEIGREYFHPLEWKERVNESIERINSGVWV